MAKKAAKTTAKKASRKTAKKTARSAAKGTTGAARQNAGKKTSAKDRPRDAPAANARSAGGPAALFDLFDPAAVMAQFSDALRGGPYDAAALHRLLDSQQKNLVALTEANRRIMAGAQAVVEKQTALLQQAASEVLTGVDPSGADGMALAARAYERAAAHIDEVSRTLLEAQQQALATLQRRWQESLDELQMPGGRKN